MRLMLGAKDEPHAALRTTLLGLNEASLAEERERAGEKTMAKRTYLRSSKSGQLMLGIPLVIAACTSARDENAEVPPTANATLIPQGPQPDFGPLVEQQESPPPISGGTLAVDRQQGLAVAADSDRDRVYVV